MGNVCSAGSCKCKFCAGFSKCKFCDGFSKCSCCAGGFSKCSCCADFSKCNCCAGSTNRICSFCPSCCQPKSGKGKEDEKKATVTNAEEANRPLVQVKPPQQEVMVRESRKPSRPTSPVVPTTPPSPRRVKEATLPLVRPTVTPTKQRVRRDNNIGAGQNPKAGTSAEANTPGGMKQPHNVRRKAASAGLQGGVLQTKTGNLKEYYTLGQKLGQGQFGTTFHCVEKGTGKEYACKSIAKRKLKTKEDVEDVRRKIQIMHHLSGHPNVIKIKGAYEDAMTVHIVMELCKGGELFDRIVERGHYSERQAAELSRVIVGVVHACHSLGVMHRDLKPENFLFVDDREDSPLQAIDFSFSIFFRPGDTFTDTVGSPCYVAPEVLKKMYGPEADVWSAGVMIYILLSGAPPFWAEAEEDIFEEILNGQLDFSADPWPAISESAKDLLKKMLVKNPKKRITTHDVLCHPWIRVDGVAPDKPLDSAVLRRLNRYSAMNKIKKMALRVIAAKLSEDEIFGLKEMFKMIDTDNSGHITLQELKAGLKAFGANLNDTEMHNLMQAADVDNSGTLDYGEFIAATLHLNKIEREDYLFAAFTYFDRDGSGYITQDELEKACEEFGLKDPRLDEMIREVDQDNDGRIDYNEFVAMMQNGNIDLGKRRLEQTW